MIESRNEILERIRRYKNIIEEYKGKIKLETLKLENGERN